MTSERQTTCSFLSFKLGNENFATNVLKVQEILSLTTITRVPQSPSYMLGVINRHGTVLSVVDARERFGLPMKEATVNTCIIVVNIEIDNEPLLIGMLVDAVVEVFEVAESEIKPPPGIGSKYKSDIIQGIVKMENHFIMLLNIDKVFLSEEIIIMKENSETSVMSH